MKGRVYGDNTEDWKNYLKSSLFFPLRLMPVWLPLYYFKAEGFEVNFVCKCWFWPEVITKRYNCNCKFVTTQGLFPPFTFHNNFISIPNLILLSFYSTSPNHFYSMDSLIEKSGTLIIFSSFIFFLKFYALTKPNRYQ